MTDIMAREALRTVLADIIDREADEVYEGGAAVNVDKVAGEVLDLFPEVEWEFTTNEHGVPVRRLAVKGEWVVDLSIVEMDARTRALRAVEVHRVEL